MKVLRDWLRDYVGDSIPETEEIERLLTFYAFEVDGIEKIDGDEIIDVKILPDRSSDCLCHRGIARELATLTGITLTHDPLEAELQQKTTDKLKISIEDPHACRRFSLALLTGITVGESPDWLKKRLHALGQRSINNVVDATNYVMLSLGQPLHAYDAKKLTAKDDQWHLAVRMAREGEKVTTLTGDTYELDTSIQLIVDGESDAVLGIAGIKGGKNAEISAGTTSIIIEAANFDPVITRRVAQKLKLTTDASKRFENGVSRTIVPFALSETVKLITAIAGGAYEGSRDVYPTPSTNPRVEVTLSRINALLGLSLTEVEVTPILKRLGFSYEISGETYRVTAPFERTDINIPEDVIEEIGRVHGYSHIVSVVPDPVSLSEFNARHYYSEKIRNILISLGFSEVITSSFRKKDSIRLANALASDKGYPRSSLEKNILEVLDRNIPNVDLLGLTDVRVFEIGTVFLRAPEGKGVSEHVSVALGVRTRQQGYHPKDDVLLKEALQGISGGLGIETSATPLKGVAEFNLSSLLLRLKNPEAYEPYEKRPDVAYRVFSAYPFVTRDIALWVPEETRMGEVKSVINEVSGNLRVRTTLFDEFRKDGKISYAFRLVFQSYEKTLTDDEVNAIMNRITSSVSERGWTVR